MTQRKSKRRLEFESLESMQLLSGVGETVPHAMVLDAAAQVHRAPVEDVALNLSGTIRGTFRVAGRGTAASFSGRGPVSPVGKAQLKGNIDLGGSGGQLTLNFRKRGKVFASVTGGTAAGGYTYQITGGTRTFAGDTGTGVAFVNILSPGRTHGRFALSLQSAAPV